VVGGTCATQVGGTEQLPQSRARRLATDEHLRLSGHPRVFAIGDVASVQIEGRELPMLSPPATQEGRHVARAILADVRGRQVRTPFRYHDKGTMAVIGRNAAVGSIGRAQLIGRLGLVAWLGVHIYYLTGFRNRAVALINWAWNYLRKDRPIRMITNVERDPLADELTESESATAATPATR
jgi:NADH:ubiquinone reductase (H+-translocating)